jgi:hypothetical protein
MTFSLMTFRSFLVISRESCDPSITTFDTNYSTPEATSFSKCGKYVCSSQEIS